MNIKEFSPYKKMTIAVLCFQVMALIIKSFSGIYSSLQLVFFRGFLSALVVLIIYKDRKTFLKPKRFDLIFFRSILGFGGLFCFFIAITRIKLANAILLNNCSPIFVALFSILIFKDKISKNSWVCFLLAFSGVYFIASPDFSSINYYALAGFISAVFSGLAYNVVKKCREVNKSSLVVFYFGFITAIASGTTALIFSNYFPGYEEFCFKSVKTIHIIPLILMGIFSYLGQYFLTEAYGGGTAHKVAIFQYSGILISVFTGFIFFGEVLKGAELFGAILVIYALYKIN